jgi:hypothetical protein
MVVDLTREHRPWREPESKSSCGYNGPRNNVRWDCYELRTEEAQLAKVQSHILYLLHALMLKQFRPLKFSQQKKADRIDVFF